MTYQESAAALTNLLGLERPPVALAFVSENPSDLITTTDVVPSACSFWVEAEREVFFATADAHYNCPVGALTMGLDMPEEVMETLGQFVEMMTGSNYLLGEEAANLPAVDRESAGIVYGPLAEFPIEPDAILFWLNAKGLMTFAESGAAGKWNQTGSTAMLGRPGCTAIPVGIESATAVSAGCAGMRTFTGVSDNEMLGVISGQRLTESVEALNATDAANCLMQDFYSGHAASFT